MGLNDKVSAERLHIGFFGICNAGKSSVVNSVTNQQLSLVSEVEGTTTDPVQKAMELLPLGAVVIIDTPGIDDKGTLGKMRVKRALQILNKVDIAILVVDAKKMLQATDKKLISEFTKKNIPYIIVYNKADLLKKIPPTKNNEIYVSAKNNTNIHELKETIGKLAITQDSDKKLVSDLINKDDIVILVTPIDSSAPKGRLILPQQQMIRDILEINGINIVVKETELKKALNSLSKKPKMVITDSQVFERVNKDTPSDILLTSFSILFARYKGDLEETIKGVAKLDKLKDGDTILISEGCTHHRQCEDIGTVKLPRWIEKYTKKELNFAFTSGGEFPENLAPYSLVVHCGGCMLNEREMKSRIRYSVDCNVPITNYGIVIAQIHGILERSLSPFPQMQKLLF